MPTPRRPTTGARRRLRLLAWVLFLKVDDAAVVTDVDGEALSVQRFDLTVDGLAEALADFVELLVEDSFLSLVWLHLSSCRIVLGRKWSGLRPADPEPRGPTFYLNYRIMPTDSPAANRAGRSF